MDEIINHPAFWPSLVAIIGSVTALVQALQQRRKTHVDALNALSQQTLSGAGLVLSWKDAEIARLAVQLQSMSERFEQKIAALQAENTDLLKRMDNQDIDIEKLMQTNVKLAHDNESLRKENQTLEAKYSALKTDFDELRAAYDAQALQLKEIQQERSTESAERLRRATGEIKP